MNFCMYENIDEKYVHSFDCYWKKYSRQLPALPTLLHSEKDGRATVFNCWIRYIYFQQLLSLKSEKAITHSFPAYLSTWMKNHIPNNVRILIEHHQHDHEYLFFFSYNLVNLVLIDMEHFLSKHEHLKDYLGVDDYYASSEHNLSGDNPIFKLIKVYIVNYVNVELTSAKCAAIFCSTLQHTTAQRQALLK